MSDIRVLPEPTDGNGRVETGPVRFGDDWPGVFIRGDNAMWYALLLKQLLEGRGDELNKMQLRGLADDLASCRLYAPESPA